MTDKPPGDEPRRAPPPDADSILLSNVRPPGYENPAPRDRYDLVVIGAGAGGLVSSAIAAGLGGSLGLWAIFAALQGLWSRTSIGQRWLNLRTTPSSIYGMTLAHCGTGIFIIGIAFTSAYTVEKDLRMTPGDEYFLSGYHYRIDGVEHRDGPN